LTEDSAMKSLEQFYALWCAPGSPYKSIDGALEGMMAVLHNLVVDLRIHLHAVVHRGPVVREGPSYFVDI